MPVVAAVTNTNNTNNFIGSLHLFKKRPNTILRILGALQADSAGGDVISGLNGWRQEANYNFPTNVDYDLPAPTQPARLEGANAPAGNTFQTAQSSNVTQIFHEQVAVTYLKQSVNNRIGGIASAAEGVNDTGLEFQIERALEKVAQDANHSMLNGVFANPANPTTTALAMRGIRTATTTTRLLNGAVPRALTKALLASTYRAMIDNAGVQPEALLCLTNTAQMAAISALYDTQFNNGQDRMVAGVMVRQIYTAFGVLNLALELDMPQGELLFVNPAVIQGVYVNVPNKPEGLFYEEMSRVGSATVGQVYGQLGIDHGPEWAHGALGDLITT
jgi:hypothetical protein